MTIQRPRVANPQTGEPTLDDGGEGPDLLSQEALSVRIDEILTKPLDFHQLAVYWRARLCIR